MHELLKVRKTLQNTNTLEEFLHNVDITSSEYYVRLFNNIYKEKLTFKISKLEVLTKLELDIIERIDEWTF